MALRNPRFQTHVYSNADNGWKHYRELYKELFRSSPILQKEVDSHLKKIGAPYWSFSTRFVTFLGDFTDLAILEATEEERTALMEKVAAKIKEILQELPDGYRFLVASDSRRFLNFVAEMDSRIYIVPGDIRHVDLDKGEFDGAWLKTFVDQHLIMNARRAYLLRTGPMYKSNFARFAAEIGGAEYKYCEF